jgi:hypothetical protein
MDKHVETALKDLKSDTAGSRALAAQELAIARGTRNVSRVYLALVKALEVERDRAVQIAILNSLDVLGESGWGFEPQVCPERKRAFAAIQKLMEEHLDDKPLIETALQPFSWTELVSPIIGEARRLRSVAESRGHPATARVLGSYALRLDLRD